MLILILTNIKGNECMSKEYLTIENEPWEAAFYTGAADVLSKRLDGILDYSDNVGSDVFYVKENDLSLLNDVVKKRLLYYVQQGDEAMEDEINALNFQLKEVQTDVNKYLCEKLKPYCSNDKLAEEINGFIGYLSRTLKKPLCIYEPIGMRDKNIDTLGEIYLYYAWDYFFISFKDYLVLLVIGTIE